jgi:Domain of unknown function (DUF1850).
MIPAARTSSTRSFLIITVLALSTLGIIAGSVLKVEVLVVELDEGKVTFRTPRLAVLEYVHSVEGGKVIELLEAREGCIRLVKLKWQGHGAGMPSSQYDINWSPIIAGDSFYEVEVNRCLGRSIVVDLGYMVEGRLTIGDASFIKGTLRLTLAEETLANFILSKFYESLLSALSRYK